MVLCFQILVIDTPPKKKCCIRQAEFTFAKGHTKRYLHQIHSFNHFLDIFLIFSVFFLMQMYLEEKRLKLKLMENVA